MKLYSARLSLFGRKVEIALDEKGLGYERIQVPFSQAEGYKPKHPDVLAANPKGQVPVLVDGDLALYDSTLIFEYLEDAYPIPPLYPAGVADRARCRQAELFADEVMLVPLRALMFRNERPLADVERLQQLRAKAREAEGVIAAHFAGLDRQLAGRDFLCGRLTVADIATFMQVLYVQRLAGPDVAGHPALAAWYRRLGQRPAFAKAVQEVGEADRDLSFPLDVEP